MAVAVGVHGRGRGTQHGVVDVEPAEDEALVLGVERGASLRGVEHQRVTLEEGGPLGVADLDLSAELAAGEALGLDAVGAHAGLLQLLVDPVDVRLFDGDLAGQLVGNALGRHGRGVARTGHAAPL